MSYLQGYWDTAKSTNTYWEERNFSGHKLVIATFPWPPKGPRSTEQQLRYIVFVLDSGNRPIRSLSYEPNTSGAGVFFGEALREGLRLNHGQIPVMTREQFFETALAKLGPPAELTPRQTLPPRPWWKFWKRGGASEAETARKEKAMKDVGRIGELGSDYARALKAQGIQSAEDEVANVIQDQVITTLTSMVVSSGVDEYKKQQAKASLIRILISEGLDEQTARQAVTRLTGMDERTARETVTELIKRASQT